jgi:hypothetical protein
MTPEEIHQAMDELIDLRLDARALIRSGNPAVRAEGQKALKAISADIRYLKDLADAQL